MKLLTLVTLITLSLGTFGSDSSFQVNQQVQIEMSKLIKKVTSSVSTKNRQV